MRTREVVFGAVLGLGVAVVVERAVAQTTGGVVAPTSACEMKVAELKGNVLSSSTTVKAALETALKDFVKDGWRLQNAPVVQPAMAGAQDLRMYLILERGCAM